MDKGHLGDLPPEIIDQVISQLEFDDIRRLSITNSNFRSFLTPLLFANLSISNDAAFDKMTSNHVDRYGQHMTHLYFRPYAYPAEEECHIPFADWSTEESRTKDAFDNDCIFKQGQHTLPATISKLLNGHGLPNLRSVSVKFAHDYHDDSWMGENGMNGFFYFTSVEHDDEISIAELKHKWRALNAETWNAVADCNSLSKLEIRNIVPEAASTYSIPE